MQTYYVNLKRPWRKIKVVEADIIVCKKRSWAVDQLGARRLVGASVFFSVQSAERARIGALVKLINPATLQVVPQVYQAAVKELESVDRNVLRRSDFNSPRAR